MPAHTRTAYCLSSIALASALFSGSVAAAGLGKLTVLSTLGQPLHAEIELTSVVKGEISALEPMLAPAAMYNQAKLDYHSALANLDFAIKKKGERYFISITSTKIFNEPFVDLLIQLNSGNTRLIQEYTFLLDPAELRTTQLTQAASEEYNTTTDTASNSRTIEAEFSPQTKPTRTRNTHSQPSNISHSVDDKIYQIKPGETLVSIAVRLKPAQITLNQMLLALYQTNPESFIDRNINRIRAGDILKVPSSNDISALSTQKARALILEKNGNFATYRSKIAEHLAHRQTKTLSQESQGVGKITAQIEETPLPEAEPIDKLKLSHVEPNLDAKASPEAQIAEEKSREDAANRIAELEKNIAELRQLLLQQNVNQTEQHQTGKTLASSDSQNLYTATPTTPAKHQIAKATSASAAEQPRFFSHLSPITLMLLSLAGACILVLMGALSFGIYKWRKARKLITPLPAEKISSSTPLESEEASDSQTVPEDSFINNNPELEPNEFPPVSQPDTNTTDPIAEADVYITYGRDEQAEETLKEALPTYPEPLAIHKKLLAIYAQRKDALSFEKTAGELMRLTKGEGEEWAHVCALGIALDPYNPLYTRVGTQETPNEQIIDTNPIPQAETIPKSESLLLDPAEIDLKFNITSPPEVEDEPQTLSDIALSSSSTNSVLDFDLGDLDLPATPIQSKAPVDELMLDLKSLNLELDENQADASDHAKDNQTLEMDTKLNLAQSYQEIGDLDGARELIEEVIQGGNISQINKANELKQKLK